MENNKTKSMIIWLVVVIILILIVFIVLKNPNKMKKMPPVSQDIVELNNAIKNDTPEAITENLNQIDMTDTTDEDLKAIDEELKNL